MSLITTNLCFEGQTANLGTVIIVQTSETDVEYDSVGVQFILLIQKMSEPHGEEQKRLWEEEQANLKKQLVLHDDFGRGHLRYIAGVDMSFWKEDTTMACAGVVVMDMASMLVVYEDFKVVELTLPYIPGFLAFRESPALLQLLKKLANEHPEFYPEVLMVDGNGLLHPRGFGLASHIGVVADMPTIGIAKNLHHVDGLCRKDLQASLENSEQMNDALPLIGYSGQILGMALKTHKGCKKPIFVSVGHRISLSTAIDLVRNCCKYRIPEPVRLADIHSRAKIRELFGNQCK